MTTIRCNLTKACPIFATFTESLYEGHPIKNETFAIAQ